MNTRQDRIRRRAERGATAAIVAILLGGGVLLGAAALAIDVGSAMFERRQLQNGADAAAFQLARICAQDAADCDPNTVVGQVNAANIANAADGAAALNTTVDATLGTVNGMCGRVPGAPASLPACPTPDASVLGQCPALPDLLVNYTAIPFVEVYTLTSNPDGSNALPRALSPEDGATVNACARYMWGPPGGGSVVPLTFAKCEYLEAIAAGFGPSHETSLPLKYKKQSTACEEMAPSGGDFSGGFGWLTTVVNCRAEVMANSWVDAQPGVGGGNGCYEDWKPGSTIYIPIFDCISDSNTGSPPPCNPGSPSGTHTWYHIDGFASFYVTGVDITGKKDLPFAPTYPTSAAQTECNTESKDKKCLFGYFLDDYIPASDFIDPNAGYYGTPVIAPAG